MKRRGKHETNLADTEIDELEVVYWTLLGSVEEVLGFDVSMDHSLQSQRPTGAIRSRLLDSNQAVRDLALFVSRSDSPDDGCKREFPGWAKEVICQVSLVVSR